MSAPYVIGESQVQPFKFWYNGQCTDVVLFRDHLYILNRRFHSEDRLLAYNLSAELANSADTLMTVSAVGYRVWTNRFADCNAA